MKPELTFSKAARLILRRSWFVLLCGIAAAAGAYRIAKPPQHNYVAQTTLHVVDTTVSYDARGEAVATTVFPRNVTDVRSDTFLDAGAADVALRKVTGTGLTPLALLDRLVVTPLSTTDVTLAFRTNDPKRAAGVVDTYAAAYVDSRRAQQAKALQAARTLMERQAKAIQTSPGGIPADNSTIARAQDIGAHVDALAVAERLLPQRIAQTGATEVRDTKKGLPRAAATAAGLLAGLAVGILIVLLLARFDRRIRKASDLRLPGVRVVEVDSERNPQSLKRLWAELELAEVEIGRNVASVAVTAPSSREATAGVARRLAEVFAASGTPTVLVDAHESAPEFAEHEQTDVQTVHLSPNLTRVAEPLSPARLTRLIADTRQSGQALVLACPAVEDDPEALLLAAGTDVVVLVVQRARSTWARLEEALTTLQTAVRRPVLVCFDRAAAPAPRAGAETQRAEHAVPAAADEVDVPVRL